MAQTMDVYYDFWRLLAAGAIDLLNDTFKLALVTSSYTLDLDGDEVWADVSANEVASGDGYTTGGAALASKTVTRSTYLTTWDAADVTWTTLTKTFRGGVIYKVATVTDPWGGADIVNPLVAYILFDDSPADTVVAGVDWTAQLSSLGLLQLGPSDELCS